MLLLTEAAGTSGPVWRTKMEVKGTPEISVVFGSSPVGFQTAFDSFEMLVLRTGRTSDPSGWNGRSLVVAVFSIETVGFVAGLRLIELSYSYLRNPR